MYESRECNKLQAKMNKRGEMQRTEWMTAAEAAAYLRVERRTLLQWLRQGKAKAFRLSGTIRHVWRFRQSDLDAMLAPSSADSADGRQ
jgi:excisionase family DNA binding protein